MSLAAKEHPWLWRVMGNDDGDGSVMVPDHTPQSVRSAALEVMGDRLGMGAEDINVLALFLDPENHQRLTWRQHTRKMPEDGYGCGCEDEGWWCEQGTSRPRLFVMWEGSFIDNAEEFAEPIEAEA